MKKLNGDYNIYAYEGEICVHEHESSHISEQVQEDIKGRDLEEKPDKRFLKNSGRVRTAMLSRNINVLGHRTSIRLEREM